MTGLPEQKARRRRLRAGAAIALATVCAAITALAWPMDTSAYTRTTPSPRMLDRHGRELYIYLNEEDAWSFPVTLDAVSPYLVKATVAAEDRRFYKHFGVDPLAVLRAAWQNLRSGRIESGASTLSMQVIKLAAPHNRSFAGKAWQALQALRLERRLNKDRILEAYLNRAPYGMNLTGCEAAARRYFGKSARELTLPEAATLAGLPKAPSRYMPLEHAQAARNRRNYVLARMFEEAYLTQAEYHRALAEPLAASWRDFPRLAPHVAARVARSKKSPDSSTSLDRDIQAKAERIVREHVRQFGADVTQAAALILDTQTATAHAWVGAADFDGPGGQVDLCRAARSPGSALKPFTYAVAIEENVLYPSEKLLDGLLDYGLYQPVNYDGWYRGHVSATYALKRSLNVPAVAVLERVGYHRLWRLMRDMRFTTLKRPSADYGLGLTLGNCEVRLVELAAAYTMLANLGAYRPVSLFEASPEVETRLLSESTCLALYSMLEQPLPTEFDPKQLPAELPSPRVCWKTGTSTGQHDAWAVVFNAHYVVAVWLGNPDGRPSHRLVGAEAALPLAARLFRSLAPLEGRPAWPETNGFLRVAETCAVTGLPKGPWCERLRTETFPAAQYLHRVCDVHRPGPQPGEVVEQWPASAKGWDLARVEGARPRLEAKAPTPNRALDILRPAAGSEFVLTGEEDGDRLRLSASLDEDETLHWYLDGRYLGRSEPRGPQYLDLTAGPHRLTCMTDQGEMATITYNVVQPNRRIFSAN